MNLRHCFVSLITTLLIFTAACTPKQPVQPVETTSPAVITPTDLPPTPEPTPVPQKSLVICLGEEPISLYPYGYNSRTMWSVLEAIYDGPFDTINFEAQPVIMDGMGEIRLETIALSTGDLVVNTDGLVVPLTVGTQVYPAGCKSQDCAAAWDGSTEL